MGIIGINYKTKTATANEIFTHLLECNNSFFPPLTDRVNIEEYSRKIFEKSVTFEAWNEHSLIGLLAAYFNDSSGLLAFITSVSVLKGFMSKGVASDLLRKCIEYAIKENFTKINLEVNKEDIKAIGLYRKFGFSIDDANNDILKMKLELIH